MPINWDTKVKDSFTLVFLFLKFRIFVLIKVLFVGFRAALIKSLFVPKGEDAYKVYEQYVHLNRIMTEDITIFLAIASDNL